MFDNALERARQCDIKLQEAIQLNKQNELPFLHGIPISVKDVIEQKGQLCTVGTAMKNWRSSEDAPCL